MFRSLLIVACALVANVSAGCSNCDSRCSGNKCYTCDEGYIRTQDYTCVKGPTMTCECKCFAASYSEDDDDGDAIVNTFSVPWLAGWGSKGCEDIGDSCKESCLTHSASRSACNIDYRSSECTKCNYPRDSCKLLDSQSTKATTSTTTTATLPTCNCTKFAYGQGDNVKDGDLFVQSGITCTSPNDGPRCVYRAPVTTTSVTTTSETLTTTSVTTTSSTNTTTSATSTTTTESSTTTTSVTGTTVTSTTTSETITSTTSITDTSTTTSITSTTTTATTATTTITTTTTTKVEGKVVGEQIGVGFDDKVQVDDPAHVNDPAEPIGTRTSTGSDDATTKSDHSALIAIVVVVVLLAAIVGFVVVRKRNLQDETDVAGAGAGAGVSTAGYTTTPASAKAGSLKHVTTNPAYAHPESRNGSVNRPAVARAGAGNGDSNGNGDGSGNTNRLSTNAAYEENSYLVPTSISQQQQQNQENQYLTPLVYDNSGTVGGAYADVDGMYSETMPNYAEVGGKTNQQAEYDVPTDGDGLYVEANKSGGGGGGGRGGAGGGDQYLAPTPLADDEALYDTAADGTVGMENSAYYATAASSNNNNNSNGGGGQPLYDAASGFGIGIGGGEGGPMYDAATTDAPAHHYEYADAAMALAAAAGDPTYAVASSDGIEDPMYAMATGDVGGGGGGGGGVVYDLGANCTGVDEDPQYDIATPITYDVAQGGGGANTNNNSNANDDGYLAVGGAARGGSVQSERLEVVESDDNVGNESEFC